MLRETFGRLKVAVCDIDTDYIEGKRKRKRKILMMFYYPSDYEESDL